MQTLQWYVNRLFRMSPQEVAHRLVRGARSRLQVSGLLRSDEQPAPVLSTEPANWIAGAGGLDRTIYERAADRLLGGRQRIFALDVTLSDPLNWNRDPLTGVVAPARPGKLIDYRDGSLVGNIKYLWEPNRHLELVTLAQAFALTGEPRFLEGIAHRLESWFDQCPHPLGVNWSSSLEAGIRLINFSVAWQLVGGRRSPLFEGQEGQRLLDRWLGSIYQHAHFIHHYYSLYSSANNHLIGEAAGVFVAACTWPYWPGLAQWGDKARGTLIEAAASQTHADGVNREQAVAYQQFVADFLILAGLAGRSRNLDFPDGYWRVVERMIEFIAAIMDASGNVPMIGDADDGCAVRLSQEPNFDPFRSLIATGAMLFDRADFAARSGDPDDKTRVLVGCDRRGDVFKGYGEPPTARPTRFADGGYYILGRDLGRAGEIRLLADCGPLGYLSIAAHGHADALAVCLSVGGREILVDPGTYTYHGKLDWRRHFRGTRAHNTVTIDGQDQSLQAGSFMWLQHATATCLHFSKGEQEDAFVGEHDGYRRLSDPVIHRREIRRAGSSFQVADTLTCRGDHSVEQWWQFAEDCDVGIVGGVVVAKNGAAEVCLTPARGGGTVQLFRGSERPIAGWVSRRYDVMCPATAVCVKTEIRGTTRLATTIDCEPG